jgi:hypothetical protein
MADSSNNTRKYRGVTALSSALNHVTNPIYAKRGFVANKIISDWELIVGKSLARYSIPRKLFFAKDKKAGGVLNVDVFDSGMAMEMTYMEPIILEKIATYFGYKAIDKLKITQKLGIVKSFDYDEAPPITLSSEKQGVLSHKLSDVSDDEMKAALERLGVSVLGQKS